MIKNYNTNQLTAAEGMVKLLDAYNVKHIFGLCGDTSLPFYDALYRLDHSINHILTRDERHASYMADAYARVTGKVGICEGPSGGGATYIVPGVVEANESSIALISLTSDVPISSIGHFPLTELDQEKMFKPLTKWNKKIDKAKKLGKIIRTAFKKSTSGRPGAIHLCFPFDIQKSEIKEDDIWVEKKFSTFPANPLKPDTKKIDKIVKEISKSKNPMIICGGAIKNCNAEKDLKIFIESQNMVLASSVTGKGTLADDHPNHLGVVGSNGGVLATREVIKKADLIIFIGCRAGSVTTEKWKYPSLETKIIHIDIDQKVFSANYKTHISLKSDAKLALITLNKKIKKNNFKGKEIVKFAKNKKFSEFKELVKINHGLIKPERIVHDLNVTLPEDTYIVVDAGTPCPYFAAYYKFKRSGKYFLTNRAHGALGYALPAAIGAQIGGPKNKVVSIMGDGSFGLAVGELETVVRLNLPITFIVISNSVYGWIKAGQKSNFEKRYYSVDFTRTDHAAVASAYGIKSWTVSESNQLIKTIKESLKHNGPTLIDIISQPLQDARAPVSEWIA